MIGQRVRRREDPRFITGRGQYVDDLRLKGALHVSFVRSEWAHARIESIDTSALDGLDGIRVFTAADLDLGRWSFPAFAGRMERPYLAEGKARFVGEILAAVLAEDRAAAADAAEQVWAELDPLPVVTDSREAIKDEVLLHEEAGTNVALADGPEQPSADLFAGCEVVATGEFQSQRVHVAPIEPRATAASWEDGKLTFWLSTQTPHQDKEALAAALGVEQAQCGCSPRTSAAASAARGSVSRTFSSPGWRATPGGRCAGPRRAPSTWSAMATGARSGSGSDRRRPRRHVQGAAAALLQDSGAYPGIGAILPTSPG